jgi:cytochrome c biogenesis protein CcmG/thiol:disulfide interchange protein DsbE
MKRLLTLTIILVLIGFAVYNHFSKNQAIPQEGYLAPPIELQGLDGKRYNLDELDKPVILNFWASWCGPCQIEAPMLINLYRKYGDHIEIYAINLTMNDKRENIEAFVNRFKLPFPVLLDTSGDVTKLYQVQVIPTTFFIDREKRITKLATGIHPKEELEELIEELIER